MRNTASATGLPADLTAERILSTAQAAQLRGVSVATFRRLVRAGKLPPPLQLSERRIGWRVRDLLAHLNDGAPTAFDANVSARHARKTSFQPPHHTTSPGRRGRRP
jgi:predicted DNA-binding transcriptional regulator AlpA